MAHIIFSLIIPHHNIPQLLKRCLCSIPKRDDLQVIVIDDKSDEIFIDDVKQLNTTFPFVEFCYLEENKGGGHARNIGLQKAKGKYVFFADADDFFTYCLNDILEEYRGCDADIVYFDAISQNTDTYKIAYRARHLNRMMHRYSLHEKKSEMELRYLFGEPWCKLVKRDIIEKHLISFDETIIHNDTKFSYLVGHYCKKIVIDQRAIYCVTVRSCSVSKIISLDRLLIRTKVFGEANVFYKTHNLHYFEEKALRPMMFFLLYGKNKEYLRCKKILMACGMSSAELFWRQVFYPYMLLEKMWRNVSEILVRFQDKSK